MHADDILEELSGIIAEGAAGGVNENQNHFLEIVCCNAERQIARVNDPQNILSVTKFMPFLDAISTPCLIVDGQNDPSGDSSV